jgi:hypothetical protein
VLVFSLAISLSSSSFRYTGLEKFIGLGGDGSELGINFVTTLSCGIEEMFAAKTEES